MSVNPVARIEKEVARLPRESPVELVQRLVRRLERDDPETRRARLIESARLMREWASRPPDHDDAWWDDFERDLRENRLTFGVMDDGHQPVAEA
jgi:hypothetical protein